MRRRRLRTISRRTLLLGALGIALPGRALADEEDTPPGSDRAGAPILFVGARTPDAPVAVFSHGLGARGRALQWLAESLAARGFFCALPTHVESSGGALRQAFVAAFSGEGLGAAIDAKVADPALEKARSADIAAALAAADPVRRAPFRVLIGHSMGAAATMIEAGAQPRFGRIGHDAFDAYVAISPDGPGPLFAPDAWRGIRKPVLIVTGTRDRGAGGDWTWRARPFDSLPPGGKRLAVIPGAGHLQLGGLGSASVRETVTALAIEFVDSARSGVIAPSRVSGAEIRDK